jgi:hypothetical protein
VTNLHFANPTWDLPTELRILYSQSTSTASLGLLRIKVWSIVVKESLVHHAGQKIRAFVKRMIA